MGNLRLPGVLAALGYLGVVAGTVAWIVAFRSTNEILVDQIAMTVGYGLAGFACWRWMVGCRNANVDRRLARTPSRWMAAASVVTAASFAAITYMYYQNHQYFQQQNGPGFVDPHYRLRMAGGGAIVLGLLLAGIGFWIASSGIRTPTGTAREPIPVP